MANILLIKYGTSAPSSGELRFRELGYDSENEKLYIGNSSGGVTLINPTYTLSSFGVTATAAELNTLDGITVSTTELNYVDGVTSSIQAQLNAKQSNITGGASSIVSNNLTAGRVLISDSSGKVAVSAVTTTELGYLDGVTSSVQTQINSKQPTITGAATSITSSNLSASRALVSDGNGKVAVSSITTTELGYLDGVTSAIQTQLNNKAASNHTHALASTTAAGFLRQLNGSTSNYLRGDGNWATPPNTTYSVMGGASTSAGGTVGLVPAPSAGAANRYLRSDGTWSVPPNTAYSIMTGATSSTAGTAGLVPAPSAGAATRYLRSDGTWQVPPNSTYTLGSFGITATAAELNRMDGITATTTELNYTDGVTSNIQTQLNAKQATITGGATTILSSNLAASRALISDSAGKVAVSTVTSTELGYLDGVTSSIQTQLNAKQSSITGGASTIASSNLIASRALISNGDGKVAVSAVTSTELGYLDGVTSGIQSQLNAKQATISGGATTITSSNLATNRTLISDGNGKVAVSAVTSTELGYLDGVTSAIQTQLNGKAASSHTHNYAGSSSAGGPANSVAQALTIQLNGSAQPAYNGSTARTINITASSIGAAATSHTHTISQITNISSANVYSAKNVGTTYNDTAANNITALLQSKINLISSQANGTGGIYGINGGWSGNNFGWAIGNFIASTQYIDALWITTNRIWYMRRAGTSTYEPAMQYIPADINGNINYNRVTFTDTDYMADYIYNLLEDAGYTGITPGGGTADYPETEYKNVTSGTLYWGSASSTPVITVEISYSSRRVSGVLSYNVRVRLEVQVKTGESHYGYPVYGTFTLNGSTKVSNYTIVYNSNWNSSATWTTGWYAATNSTTGSNPMTIRIDSGSYSSGGGGRAAQTYSYTI